MKNLTLPVTNEKINEMAKEFGTPFHMYDEKGIRENARLLNKAFSWAPKFREYFAVKALPNPHIVEILKEEGFIVDYKVKGNVKKELNITLKYAADGTRVISGLKKISKPGLRVNVGCDKLPRVLKGLGIAIISTSQGVLTDAKARTLGVGGEVIAYVW